MDIIAYLPKIIATGLVLISVPVSKYIIRRIVRKYSAVKSESRMLQLIRVTSLLINFTAIFTLAIIWGVNPQNMLIALSSIFAVIGVAMFAQWSLLSNVTAGIIIFFTTPFRIGDKIHIHDKEVPITAHIENVLTFYTHLRTDSGELIIIPNSLFLQKTISLMPEQENSEE